MPSSPHFQCTPTTANIAALGLPRIAFMFILIVLALLCISPAKAQVTVGDNANLSLSGDIATGYTGGFGDTGSNHGLSLGGNATLHGYYYDPQFISFNVQPFYNRSQANSTYQSLTNSSGFLASTSLFSGSHFPGSVSFSRTFDTTGEFAIPGVAGLETSGSAQTIDLTWSVLIPDLPTLRATYIINGNDISVSGAPGNSRSSSRTLSLNSDYNIRGFGLRGFYGHGSGHSQFPSFLNLEQIGSLDNGSSQFGGMVTHAIPLRGYWTAQATHSTFSSDFGNAATAGSSSGANTSISTSVTLMPIANLGMGLGADYQTNAFGALQQQIIEAGGVNPLRLSEITGSSAGVSGSVSYTISHYLFLTGQFSHRDQNFESRHFAITQYGGGATFNFSRRLLGSLSFSVGANDTATQQGNSGAGLYTNLNFSRKIQAWDVSSNFSYNQTVQTLLAIYTTSMYGYGASVRRKFRNELYWGVNFTGNHSALERVAGSTSHANTLSTYVNFHRYNVNGVYSQSGGISIVTPQGLVPLPTGVPFPLFANMLLYDAKSYGGGFGATLKRVNVSVSYGRTFSDTGGPSGLLNNRSTLINARVRYRVRKMYLDSGFTQFHQSIGTASAQPTVINSYYIGISRWFNVF